LKIQVSKRKERKYAKLSMNVIKANFSRKQFFIFVILLVYCLLNYEYFLEELFLALLIAWVFQSSCLPVFFLRLLVYDSPPIVYRNLALIAHVFNAKIYCIVQTV